MSSERWGAILTYHVHKVWRDASRGTVSGTSRNQGLLLKEPTVELPWQPDAVSKPSQSSVPRYSEISPLPYQKVPFLVLAVCTGLFLPPKSLDYHQLSTVLMSLNKALSSLGQLSRSSPSAPQGFSSPSWRSWTTLALFSVFYASPWPQLNSVQNLYIKTMFPLDLS